MIQQVMNELSNMFSDLRFDETRHLYFVNGENYPSVSKKLEGHYEKFDEDTWLPRCAPKEGCSVEELRNRWHKDRDDSCDLGHRVHSFLEDYGNGTDVMPELPQEYAGISFLQDYIFSPHLRGRYMILTQEFRMIHRLYRFCGTTDLLLWDNELGKIIVADWKTNKDLFKTYGHLKIPFERLDSNPYNKYQIQLTYYQLMIEQGPYKVEERWLIYLDPNGTYTLYKTVDLRDELIQVLNNPEIVNKPAAYGLLW